MTNLGDVLTDAVRITRAVDLPLLVDIDTGGATPSQSIARCGSSSASASPVSRSRTRQGRSAAGHRPNKAVVETSEMVSACGATGARPRSRSFVVVARTDARAVEGLDHAIERAVAYAEAGADVIFAEAPESVEELRAYSGGPRCSVLANITEFGLTPLLASRS